MDDQTIQSVADADAACLGIVDNLAPFFFVSIFVKIVNSNASMTNNIARHVTVNR